MKGKAAVSAIIPAYNEAERIEATLEGVRSIPEVDEVIVVDDGSEDFTSPIARRYADSVIRLPSNCGKGTAMREGVRCAAGEVLLFVDADLKEHAKLCGSLLVPLLRKDADMTIARFPPSLRKGGFGLVKGVARSGVLWLTGVKLDATLSGQRAVRREVWESLDYFPAGFGVELGLTVHALQSGYTVREVPLPIRHRETGRDWQGFRHRGKQLMEVLSTLFRLWRLPA
ncbi:glycosyltransferase family 2 protein [Paludifilum halophilum]|uniref:Glucosyl-3-phosphoglycerate synthase n=1 Tax=Paludifilum halophilum TaxID=1642702 RepID=A0A235BCX2_9BACL|nr:glycosyltransferase family 2 protein [Paludifilum halophilum]OYD09817.1 glycosyl transferase [Paludifilum halophilum]